MKLDVLKASIKQEEALGITKLTEQAIEDQIQRHNQFSQNEEKIKNELADAQAAFEAKNKAIKREEETIKDLHVQLERLEQEKKEVEDEIGDLTASVKDPQPKNRAAPKWAAIEKKQLAYEKGMTEYKSQQEAIDREYLFLKEERLVALRKQISIKEEEILLIQEKIKIKL